MKKFEVSRIDMDTGCEKRRPLSGLRRSLMMEVSTLREFSRSAGLPKY